LSLAKNWLPKLELNKLSGLEIHNSLIPIDISISKSMVQRSDEGMFSWQDINKDGFPDRLFKENGFV
jgi:hypothetical protein